MNNYDYIKHNLEKISASLADAAARSGNPVPELVAVTKSAAPEEVLALAELGIPCMAENRVQLLRERKELLSERGQAFDLIGSLQTNKVKYVVGQVRLIQSLDSLRLAAEINRIAEKRGETVSVLVEINSAREEAKGGISPEEAESFLAALAEYPAVRPVGLMTMGPASRDPEALRACFRETRERFLALSAAGAFKTDSPILSMGMSESYIIAAEEGATMVRVGRALFERA